MLLQRKQSYELKSQQKSSSRFKKKSELASKLGIQSLSMLLKDEDYFNTINYLNMTFVPELRRTAHPKVLFKDKQEDDPETRVLMRNAPRLSAISMRFRIGLLEMDYSSAV